MNRMEPSAFIVNSSYNLLYISRSSLLHDLNCFVTSAIRNHSPDNINTLNTLTVSSFLACSFISSIETVIVVAYCETKFTYSSVMVDENSNQQDCIHPLCLILNWYCCSCKTIFLYVVVL